MKYVNWNEFKKSTFKVGEFYKFKCIYGFAETAFKFACFEEKSKNISEKEMEYWFIWYKTENYSEHKGYLTKHISKDEGIWLIRKATKIEKQKLVEDKI